MLLRLLLAGCEVRSTEGNLEGEISGVTYDSRKVLPGFAFVAIRGVHADGNHFVAQALANGAAAIVSRSAPDSVPAAGVAQVQVEDERLALAAMAGNFYGHPTRSLQLVGVTGTNGKTTTTYLVEAILKAAGCPAAVFGTIEYRGPDFAFEAERTTPEAPDLEELFRRVLAGGWKHAVMEVSSHAVELKRVHALYFDVAVFTNLSRDHLDFHGDMRSYFLAKKRLFSGMGGSLPRIMVLNQDDPVYPELRAIAPGQVLSYGMHKSAEVFPVRYQFGWNGTAAVFRTPVAEISVQSRLMGTPNLYNIGAAIGVAVGLGLPADAIRQGLEALSSVPGRFEAVDAGQDFRVLVDYAHSDDALDKLLRAVREFTAGRILAVFGCGGDRDRSKRQRMGEVAGRGADRVVVTSDNPRSEDPMSIILEVEEGLKRVNGVYDAIADRREAIRFALSAAQRGDTVVIAGKGHETYQIIGSLTLPFDDRAVARELIHELDIGRNRQSR